MSDNAKSNNTPIIFGIIFAAISILIAICSGSPLDMLHKLEGIDIMPPMWLLCLSQLIVIFLAGYALGALVLQLSSKRLCGEKEVKAYQGGIFFIAFTFLSFAYYPVFFVAEKPLIAVLISVMAIICSAISFAIWSKISFSACMIMALNTLWFAYITFLSIKVLISL